MPLQDVCHVGVDLGILDPVDEGQQHLQLLLFVSQVERLDSPHYQLADVLDVCQLESNLMIEVFKVFTQVIAYKIVLHDLSDPLHCLGSNVFVENVLNVVDDFSYHIARYLILLRSNIESHHHHLHAQGPISVDLRILGILVYFIMELFQLVDESHHYVQLSPPVLLLIQEMSDISQPKSHILLIGVLIKS
jgi:hypothetical protein